MSDLRKPAGELLKYIYSRRLPVEEQEYRDVCNAVEEKIRAEGAGDIAGLWGYE